MSNYSGPSSLAEYLHKANHWDGSMSKFEVTPTNVVSDPDRYIKTLIMWGCVTGIIAIVYCVLDFVYILLKSYCLKPSRANMKEEYFRLRLNSGRFFAIGGAACIIVAYCFCGQFGLKARDVTQYLKDAEDYQSSLDTSIHQLNTLTELDRNIAIRILSEQNDTLHFPRDEAIHAGEQYMDAQKNSQNLLDMQPRVNIAHAQDQVRDAKNTFMNWIMLALSFTICITMYLFVLTCLTTTPSKWLTTAYIGTLAVLIFSMIGVSYSLGGSIGLADVCVDPYTYADLNANKFLSAKHATVFRHYLYCSPSHTHPYLSTLSTISLDVNSTAPTDLPALRQFAIDYDPLLLPLVSQLEDNVTQSLQLVQEIQQQTDCMRVHNDIVGAMTVACTDGLSSLWGLFVVHLMGCLFLFAIRWWLPARFTEPERDATADDEFVHQVDAQSEPNVNSRVESKPEYAPISASTTSAPSQTQGVPIPNANARNATSSRNLNAVFLSQTPTQ
eukprot:TRINITY_DN3207_c0_g1_i1.p1 TRINITY_DN3207_c0_g1~~TRINITY_DN3207_c0_g1_i1.p1  ORF type:complete len:499 (-),score=95.35 TRINITY_DN3207_c0_g1_i1:159-1655(-)